MNRAAHRAQGNTGQRTPQHHFILWSRLMVGDSWKTLRPETKKKKTGKRTTARGFARMLLTWEWNALILGRCLHSRRTESVKVLPYTLFDYIKLVGRRLWLVVAVKTWLSQLGWRIMRVCLTGLLLVATLFVVNGCKGFAW